MTTSPEMERQFGMVDSSTPFVLDIFLSVWLGASYSENVFFRDLSRLGCVADSPPISFSGPLDPPEVTTSLTCWLTYEVDFRTMMPALVDPVIGK